VLALVLALFLFAQAGVPFTSGFFAKFYVINAAVNAGSTWLAAVAMLSAVIAAFVYLRITVSMYMADPPEAAGEGGVSTAPRIAVPAGATIALTLCVIVTIGAGLWPGSIADLARDAVPVLATFG
jgi:NADH-quinone oxidoreductase subunit N